MRKTVLIKYQMRHKCSYDIITVTNLTVITSNSYERTSNQTKLSRVKIKNTFLTVYALSVVTVVLCT